METVEHLVASLITAPVAAAILFGVSGTVFVILTALGVAAGVLIDLDHFLIQRLRDGNWQHLEEALSNPGKVTTKNQEVLENPIPNWSRYLSHFAILATVPAAASLIDSGLGTYLYVMFASHVGCDVFRSWRKGRLFF